MEGCSTSELVACGGFDSKLSMCLAHQAACPRQQWLPAAFRCLQFPLLHQTSRTVLHAAGRHLLNARSTTVISPAALPRSPTRHQLTC
jgi:hypothetical protein